MKLTPTSSGKKRTQTAYTNTPINTTSDIKLHTITEDQRLKFKEMMHSLYDMDQPEFADPIFEILSNLGQVK